MIDYVFRHIATETPTHITQYMMELAGVSSHDTVLEPSAGWGAMVKVLAETANAVCAVELNTTRQEHLKDNMPENVTIYRPTDFLCLKPEEFGMFDHVIMCPPANSSDHIRHALGFVRTGGKVVALVQEQNIDIGLWPTYKRTKTQFQFGGKPLDCGIITLVKA